jgi:hypothetical protein
VPNWPGQAWFQELMFLPVTVLHLPRDVPLFASGVSGGRVLSPPPKWGVLAVHVDPARAGHVGPLRPQSPMLPRLPRAPPSAAWLERMGAALCQRRLALTLH